MNLPTPPSQQQLRLINNQALRYPLDLAEKDYYLTAALSLIAQSPLTDRLVFKGGTALHHCYLPHYRFSEDLDFSCRAPRAVTLEEVKAALETGGLFEVRKEYVSNATIKIERLRYAGILPQPGVIKVEIDHLQNVLLAPVTLPYRNVWGLEIALPVMQIKEIAAEKLRAASHRARYRDFYDLYLIFEEYAPAVDELVELLHHKEMRRPMTVEGLRANWERAVQELTAGTDMIHYSRNVTAEKIAKLVEGLRFDPVLPAGV